MQKKYKIFQGWRQAYRRMGKPAAIEDGLDLYLIRPAGFLLVQVLRRMPVSPNLVSLASVAAGWLGAVFAWHLAREGFSAGAYGGLLLGMGLTTLLDSADGQLARVQGNASPLGRTIDGFCDNLVFLGFYLAILLGLWQRQWLPLPWLFFLAVFAGVSHSLQSAMTDYYRQLYLYYLYGKDTALVENRQALAKQKANEKRWLPRFLLTLHHRYACNQLSLAGFSPRVLQVFRDRCSGSPFRKEPFIKLYESGQASLLRGWALLGSNPHKGGLLFAGLLPVTSSNLLAGAGMAWYWLYECILLNLLLVLMLRRQRAFDEGILMGALKNINESGNCPEGFTW